ncbi:MAG TPA: phosphoribosyltransferase family protein [Nitrososphaeraceae archaeon]|nr:phosphoribosyltransferase family protein [Nitrososphaeraceae archaeon]
MSRSLLGDDLTRKIEQDNDDYFSRYIYKNREEAATRLAAKLKLLLDKSASEFTILAIPRGGVVTGDVVASHLGAKLDIVVSRKIGAPHNSEVAIGAVMHDGSFYPNQDIISKLSLSQEYIDEHISIQRKEIDRRLMRFRGSNQYQLQGKSIILVDDGIATGATMFAVINWLGNQKLRKLIVAVPVAPKDTFDKLKEEEKVDDVVVLQSPIVFWAVGEFYQDFSQVSDEQVVKIMDKHRYKHGL